MSFQYINLDYLDLMSDGDESMKRTLIEMLLEEIPTEIEKMRQLHTSANLGELREVSHKLKSTLAFIGNPTMTVSNQRVEEITKMNNGSVEELPSLLNTLASTYPLAINELKTVFSSTTTV